MISRSAEAASASAASPRSRRKLLRRWSSRSMRERQDFVSSTGETSRRAMRSAASAIVGNASSPAMTSLAGKDVLGLVAGREAGADLLRHLLDDAARARDL